MDSDHVTPSSSPGLAGIGGNITAEETPSLDQSIPRTPPPASDPLDLMHRIGGMYRLLDLISENGSGGAGLWCS